jgi:serine/threonine protein kinase
MVADSAHTTANGPTTGEYQTLQELAAGGMGSVFLARAVRGPHAGKLVALKRMHPHLERNPQFAAGFFDEAWITAGLKHRNIVDTYDWGTDREGRYIALEFVAGDSVLNLLKAVRSKGQHMPIDVVLFIVGKTAEALHAAHELRNERGELRHLVHRDVTPSNILVSRDGEVKLIDFGVAKARERLQNNTTTNTLKGKFGYMSPEQARGVKNLDRRSDLWSLGVVLWECLAGRRLFKSESELEILRMVTEDTPASVRSVRPEVPEAIDSLLSSVFAKNRDDRLGSCAEFADYLWAVFHEEGYSTDERKIAQFFREALPERCASLDKLLAGEDWHLEPTSAGPGSGSFNGADARSGIAPMQRPPLATGAGFAPVDSNHLIYPAAHGTVPPGVHTIAPKVTAAVPALPAAKSRSHVITIVSVSVALLSIGAAGAVIAKSRSSAPIAAASAGTTSAPSPAMQAAPTPARPEEPSTPTQNSVAPPANAAPSETPTVRNGRNRVGMRPSNASTRAQGTTTVIQEQTQQVMLRPPAATGSNSNASTSHTESPTPRPTPPASSPSESHNTSRTQSGQTRSETPAPTTQPQSNSTGQSRLGLTGWSE